MSLFAEFGLILAIAVAMCGTILCYRAFRRSDFVIISAFGRNFTINNPFPAQKGEHLYILESPYIRPVNEFLLEFANSTERTIELTSEAIALNSAASPLRVLQGLEYEKIRLRLRVLSNLNPVVNLKAEEGVIRFSRRLASDMMQGFEIRSVFAPKGQSIQLEKLRLPFVR